MVEIPLEANINQTFMVTLNSQDCTIKLYQRGGRLFMDLTADGSPVCQGAVCLPKAGVLQRAQGVFNGQLYFTDELVSASAQTQPQYTGLGSRYHLYYLTEEEEEEVQETMLANAQEAAE